MNEILDAKNKVAALREEFANVDIEKVAFEQSLKKEIEELTERRRAAEVELLTKHDHLQWELDTAEHELKDLVIENYKETGVKSYDKEVGVRVSVSLSYDQPAAVSWAKTNAPIMIVESVDKKQFEAYAKANELPFVEKVEKISAVIASVLTEQFDIVFASNVTKEAK
jgi:hypothetical protein